ncbi:putative F-box protein At1g65770 [Benincasa hispida]|uniref:putative F-box protein At1g65770 n=1 Tax=Benincasa hispida TaxID=102211 RepID=UPI001901154F|nr:putative F-box protein At1g65770 [Benincasa hispida]
MEKSRVRWSDLPPQLWPLIGKRLDNYIDIVRYRSVCRSWRASLPQLNAISLLSPLRLPHPADHRFEDVLVIRRIIYAISPLHHHQISTSPSASRASEGWLAKIETTKLGKMRFLSPLCTDWVKSKNRVFQKEVNLLDFRIHEVAKSYILRSTIGGIVLINKVVIFPDSAWIDVKKNSIIVAVRVDGKLGFTKFGDNNWTLIGNPNFQFDDLIVYKGEIYTVNRQGTVFLIDSSMKLVQISPELGIFSNQKHLVECGGEIYVVDRFLESKKNPELIYFFGESLPSVVDFKVVKLEQEIRGRSRWVEVKNLGNQAFVLGHNCFSVSAADFEGFKENCIYFSDELNSDLGYGFSTHVFDLQERTIVQAPAQIFRAPPIWLR